MNPYAAIVLGVGVAVLVSQTRRRNRSASLQLPASSPEAYDWGETEVLRSDVPTSPRRDTTTAQTPSPTRTPSTQTTGTPPRTPAPQPPPRVATPAGGNRQIAAIQTILNEIHAYIASASGRALHPQIAVTGRLDGNTFRAWNMLCQTAYGLHHARGCVPWIRPSYPLSTAYAPAPPLQQFWLTQAAFEAAVNAQTPVTTSSWGEGPMSVREWLSRVYQNRTHDNKPMHLDALSDYWKRARAGGCWRYV